MIVKPPAQFVQVGLKMFCADFAVRARNRLPEKRPDIFVGSGGAFRYRASYPVAKIPCCLVGHADYTPDPVCGYIFPGLYDKIGSQKPLPQREVGIVEDSSGSYGELVAA